ncbi:MAG: hypothetical protein V1809_01010 [Planctomycetota bacterium]
MKRNSSGVAVDTGIPYGNAADVAVARRGGEVVVEFSADPHGGNETLWFCFRLTGRAAVPVRLVLKHSPNMLGCGRPAFMRPVIRSSRRDWERLAAPEVTELPDGRPIVLWKIRFAPPRMDVAWCYPYGLPEIEALLRDTNGYWRLDTVGVSGRGRPLLRLSNGDGIRGDARPGLFLMARQHSGETPGGWMLDGFLRALAELKSAAPLVWAVPLANRDGVEEGDYGKDPYPYDLNRAWGEPPMRYEVLAYQRLFRRWMERCRPVLAMDFHAPGGTETDGVYCFLPDPKSHPEPHAAIRRWAEVAKKAVGGDYAADNFCRVADYPSRFGSGWFKAFCWERGKVPALSLETSYALVRDTVLTRERYREMGARLAAGVTGAIFR